MGLVPYDSTGSGSAGATGACVAWTDSLHSTSSITGSSNASRSIQDEAKSPAPFSPVALRPHLHPQAAKYRQVTSAAGAALQRPTTTAFPSSTVSHRLASLNPVTLEGGIKSKLIQAALFTDTCNFVPQLCALVDEFHGSHLMTFQDCFFINSPAYLLRKLERISQKIRANNEDPEAQQELQELQTILFEEWSQKLEVMWDRLWNEQIPLEPTAAQPKPALAPSNASEALLNKLWIPSQQTPNPQPTPQRLTLEAKWQMFLNIAPENVVDTFWKRLWMASKADPNFDKNFLKHLMTHVPVDKPIFLMYFDTSFELEEKQQQCFLRDIYYANKQRPLKIQIALDIQRLAGLGGPFSRETSVIHEVEHLLKNCANHGLQNLTVKIDFDNSLHLNLIPIIKDFIGAWKDYPNAFLRIEKNQKYILIMQKKENRFEFTIGSDFDLRLDDLAAGLPRDIAAILKKGGEKIEKVISPPSQKQGCVFM